MQMEKVPAPLKWLELVKVPSKEVGADLTT